MDKIKLCPFTRANSNEDSLDRHWPCDKERCAWWSEDAQKCAMLVIAESQRKAVKGK